MRFINFLSDSQLGSVIFQGSAFSAAKICFRFFQVLFFFPAAAPPIPEC